MTRRPVDGTRRRRAARHLALAAAKLLTGGDAARHLRKALLLLKAGSGAAVAGPAPDTDVDAQRHHVARPLPEGAGPVCLFVAYTPDGRLWPHTLDYCRSLRAAGCRLVLILTTDRADLRCLDPGPEVADAVVVRENHGLDFAAWASVLRLWPALWTAPALWFANDSVYHARAALMETMAEVEANGADVVAMTASRLITPHFQSYFFVLKAPALATAAARDFFAGVRALGDKDAVIATYEARLQGALAAGGARVAVLFGAVAPAAENPTLGAWRALAATGCPFVKVQLLRDNPYGADLAGWRAVLAGRGFPVDDIELHLGALPQPAAALMAP